MPDSGPHVLILSPGSKIALTRALAEATSARGGRLSGWEADPFSPAATLCSARVQGGPVEDPDSAEQLLEWCVRKHVNLVVPSRHDDLPTLAHAAARFAAAGVTLAISAPETIALCLDKVASHAWLRGGGFPVPTQASVAELATSPLAGGFPLVAKYPRGSGSRHVRVCRNPSDLAGLDPDWIVQSHAPGVEYTINTYAARDGRCLCEIPHERLLIGDGEVVRGRTARQPALMDLARRITEALPGARGPLNIQAFWDEGTRTATVIEINPRFGGGYPLAHEAGGRFAEWLIAEYLDGRTLPRVESWEDGLLMVRYREAKFFRAMPPR
ncbi:MAG: ATP-grasp domain-containing protein [Opitutaceae bacterium]|nr:ATP-grasp domain-containing protein [Opitutaceae bacterium]